ALPPDVRRPGADRRATDAVRDVVTIQRTPVTRQPRQRRGPHAQSNGKLVEMPARAATNVEKPPRYRRTNFATRPPPRVLQEAHGIQRTSNSIAWSPSF